MLLRQASDVTVRASIVYLRLVYVAMNERENFRETAAAADVPRIAAPQSAGGRAGALADEKINE